MESFKLKKAQPFYEQLYHRLKQMIIEGELAPGYRINEVKIAQDFHVSRSPVREAVRALEKEGLLVMNEKSQLTVYKPSLKDIEELYQCRMSLESLSVELAVANAKAHDIEALENLLNQTKAAIDDGADRRMIIEFNSQFHDLILAISQNCHLQKLVGNIRALTQFYRVMNLEGDGRREMIFKEHQLIFDQFKKGNPEEAKNVMKAHILHDMNHLKQRFIQKFPIGGDVDETLSHSRHTR